MKKPKKDTVIIHSLLIPTLKGPLIISISGEYRIEINEKSMEIVAATPQALPMTLKRNIGSFHTLFGINGSGKTDILLRIARSFGRSSGVNDISIYYEKGDELLVYLGADFKDFKLAGQTEAKITKICPQVPAVFYTSSPYERARRSAVMSKEYTIDVSPKYGETNQLDGLALLEFHQQLPGQFIKRAKLAISPQLLSIHEICERLSSVVNSFNMDFDAGNILRDLLYRGANESLREETLRLRILCSMAEKAEDDATFRRVWPTYFAKIMMEFVARNPLPSYDREPVGIRKMPFAQRQRIIGDIAEEFRLRVEPIFNGGKEVIKTLEDLSSWLTSRKRGVIQTTLSTFESNLDKYLPDRETLQHCSELGLVVFSLAQLSSGETAISVLSAALYGVLKKISENYQKQIPLFLMIDEGEMFLHPKWQREYIGRILDLITSFPDIAKNTHVIISSHSLIVAADTPPNGLIDIDNSRTINGFGLGPKTLLEKIYHVDDLSGEYTQPALAELAAYFENGDNKIVKSEALLTAEALADEDVRNYLVKRIKEKSTS